MEPLHSPDPFGEPDAARGARAASAARAAVTLRDHGRATVSQIARLSGLSRPTVDSAVGLLIERGLAVDDVPTTGGRGNGRPARAFSFQPSAGYVVGVDAGLHHVKVAVADLGGRVVAWNDEAVSLELNGADRLAVVRAALDDTLNAEGIGRASVTAIGVAVTGYVGEDNRIVLSHNTPDWEGVDLAKRIGAGFDCPVVIENDIRLAALAEHRYGAAKLMDDVLYVFAGHRVSLGLIINGQLRRGHHGAAGEVGDLIFSEQVYERNQLRWETAADAESVFSQARAGDESSEAEVLQFVTRLSRGLATVAMALDPDVIVIGGGLSRAGDALLEPLRTHLLAGIAVPVSLRLVGSALGTEAVVLGALARAFTESSMRVFGVRDLPDPALDIPLPSLSRSA